MRERYLDTILQQVPRLIGQQDRNPLSPTNGCFDRQFWHYKVTGLPSARYQEAGLTLALLYHTHSSQNPYYRQKKIKQWALASVAYWAKIQTKNGSFNEWYPNEHSFVATAFSLYAATEICLLFPSCGSKFIPTILRAAEWLLRQTELDVSNQQAGACIALYNVFLLTKNERYRRAAEYKFSQIAQAQTAEGWVIEYGGADIGYSTVMLDYLAKYYQKSQNKAVLPVLRKLSDFLEYFIHPGNSWGGEYGSRNTEYVLPHGTELCADFSPAAQRLSYSLLEHLEQNDFNLDDRYLCNNGYTFLQAYRDFSPKKNDQYKWKHTFTKRFPDSGLFVTANKHYYLVANLKKGGAMKIFDVKSLKLVAESAGPLGLLTDGQVISTQYIDELATIEVKGSLITIRGNFKYAKTVKNSTIRQSVFHLFQSIFGRFPVLARLAKKLLRRLLIVGQKSAPVAYELSINLGKQSIQVDWKIRLLTPKLALRKVFTQVKYSLAYIPSSRYFLSEVLDISDRQLSQQTIDQFNRTRNIHWRQSFEFPTNGMAG